MRNVWIISERGDDARDNGYFFFKYLLKKHSEITVFYIITKESSDSDRIDDRYQIETNSFKHFIVFALCKVRISSNAWGGDIPAADYYRKLGLYKSTKKKVVFLQHGITKDFQPGLCYQKFRPSLFICGAEPEYKYIQEAFGHPKGVVQYTGFARFDSLLNPQMKKQILIMPTFRKWLQGISEKEFINSDFYQKWQLLLDSLDLRRFLENEHIELIFYPHYEIQRFTHLFNSGSKQVTIADFNHYDVQTLLKESKLLITDYSSVFFDFSYMRKPVIFYQFDREKYIKDHYDFTKGYFDYDTMAPGKVLRDDEDLLKEVIVSIESDFKVNQEYIARRERFFRKSDQHNCDRIFEEISVLLRKT